MKSMTKGELARQAGVTPRTLRNWLQPYQDILEAMGVRKKTKMLPPHAVKWIADKFLIDV